MKTLGVFLYEAAFLEGPYIRTRGKYPPPLGCFKFSVDPNADPEDDRYWYVSKYGYYEDAKNEARNYWPNAKNIYLMP